MAGFIDMLQAALSGKQKPVSPVAGLTTGGVPSASGAVLNIPTGEELGGANTIMGMEPAKFAMLAGGISSALAPKGTWQHELGGFAQTLGKGATTAKRIGADVKGAELKKKSKLAALPELKIDLSKTLLGR